MKKTLKIAGAVCLIVMSLFNFSCGGSAEKSDSTEKRRFSVSRRENRHKNGFILVKDSRGYRLASFTKTSDPIDN